MDFNLILCGEKNFYRTAIFWKRIRRKKLDIKYIATDLSAAFISSVLENCPNAVHVFDHFHVVKLMNEKLDEIRRAQYNL